ncbi:MAG: DUF4346 domain-containing protein [Prochloraceae cyanobacterium]
MNKIKETIAAIDDRLSKRHIDLDPAGYFIIYLDREAQLICADYYTNIITERGLAADPETGEVIAARGKTKKRTPRTRYTARTAKELCVKIVEQTQPRPLSMMDHAAYLGREFMRAENALITGEEYVQD